MSLCNLGCAFGFCTISLVGGMSTIVAREGLSDIFGSAFVGLIVIVLAMIPPGYLMKKIQAVQRKRMKKVRVAVLTVLALLNEVLDGCARANCNREYVGYPQFLRLRV